MEPPKVTLHETGADAPAAAPIGKPGTVVDGKGRKIVVKLLTPLEQYRISKILGPAGDSDFTRQIASNVATIREFEGEPEAFPNSDREIEALIQRLGDEGFEALHEALADLLALKPKKVSKDPAKN